MFWLHFSTSTKLGVSLYRVNEDPTIFSHHHVPQGIAGQKERAGRSCNLEQCTK